MCQHTFPRPSFLKTNVCRELPCDLTTGYFVYPDIKCKALEILSLLLSPTLISVSLLHRFIPLIVSEPVFTFVCDFYGFSVFNISDPVKPKIGSLFKIYVQYSENTHYCKSTV